MKKIIRFTNGIGFFFSSHHSQPINSFYKMKNGIWNDYVVDVAFGKRGWKIILVLTDDWWLVVALIVYVLINIMGVTVCLNMLTKQPSFFLFFCFSMEMTLLKIVYLLLGSLLFLHSFSWFCHFLNGFMTTYGTDSVEKQMIYLKCNELCTNSHLWLTRAIWGSFDSRKCNILEKNEANKMPLRSSEWAVCSGNGRN